MGLLRLNVIGEFRNPLPQYVALIERNRDHVFLDFAGSKPPAGASTILAPAAPPSWSVSPRQVASPPMLRKADYLKAGKLLQDAWFLDIDVSNFEDADYVIWFVDPDAGLTRDGVILPIIGGDDTSLTVRFRTQAANFNWSMTGLPGTTGAVKGNGGFGIALPKA